MNRANPTTRVAPAFENEIPTEAFEGFELVDAGPELVPEGFPDVVPVGLLVPLVFDFVTPEVVVESPPKIASKNGPVGKTSVVTAAPALLMVIVWPSPIHVVAMLPTGTVVAVFVPLSSSSVQPDH